MDRKTKLRIALAVPLSPLLALGAAALAAVFAIIWAGGAIILLIEALIKTMGFVVSGTNFPTFRNWFCYEFLFFWKV